MEELILQEKFEIELLDYLNSGKFLEKLIFVGGTMLRLCYGLNRFSIDLDFWVIKKLNFPKFFENLEKFLRERYAIKDSANKYYTILFEIKSPDYPRSLKIEIRKEKKKIRYEKMIAFSKFSNTQVLVNSIKLQDMMEFKIKSFLEREEIRDCFDIEFLLRRGIPLKINKKSAEKLIEKIEGLTKIDYKVKLGAILEKKDRDYYLNKNFEFLKSVIKTKIIKHSNSCNKIT